MKRYIKCSDEWDPYQGKKYRIDCGDYQIKYTDSPSVAIRYWFQGSEKHSGECAIMARNKSDALAVAELVTPELLERLNERYPCGYKLEYLLDWAEKFVERNGSGFLGDGEYGDQVTPFTYG